MTLQEIHKIPLTYAHWSNRIDSRDIETAGILKQLLPIGEKIEDLFAYVSPETRDRIGFILEMNVVASGNTPNACIFSFRTRSGVFELFNSLYLPVPIYSPHVSISVINNMTYAMYVYMCFTYVPIHKYNHYSLGQDSLTNSGPAVGIDGIGKKGIKV